MRLSGVPLEGKRRRCGLEVGAGVAQGRETSGADAKCRARGGAGDCISKQAQGLPGGSVVETQETWVRSLTWEDPLEKETATHSRILAWEVPWTEKPGWLQYMGLQKSQT